MRLARFDVANRDASGLRGVRERTAIDCDLVGWRLLLLRNGKKVIYHNGRWHGTNAAFAKLTDEDVTIVIIGNRYNSNIYNIARKAYDLFGDYQQGGPTIDEEGDITYHEPPPVVHRHVHRKSLAKRSTRHKRYISSSSRSVVKSKK